MALAHFKFFPGWKQKTDEAIRKVQHHNGSIKYKALKLAYERLEDWPLEGPWSKEFASGSDLEKIGLVFDRL